MSQISFAALRGIEPEALLERLGFTQPPFNAFKIAKSIENLKLSQEVEFDKMDKSGSICMRGGIADVWVNPVDIPERQGFTLAHEIGHLVYDLIPAQSGSFVDDSATLYRSGDNSPEEKRANDFAARLLMPKDHIIAHGRKVVNDYKTTHGTNHIPADTFVVEMSKQFEVSKQAMTFRLQNLGIIQRQ